MLIKNRPFFYLVLLTTLVHLSCNSSRLTKPKTANSPNLIVILADDLGYADVGFNGCQDIPTPNIDRIASSGVRFTNGYVSFCACGPSRAGLITGRYQDRFGFTRNPLFAPNDPQIGLPLSEETLATALQKARYKSAAIGKWHLGAHHTLHPLKRGFDDFYGFLSGGHRYFPHEWTLEDEFEARKQFDGYNTKLLRNHERVEESEYLTDALSREAASYIEAYQDHLFFIYLAYNAPHTPLQATEKYLSRFDHIEGKKRKTYAAMVSAVDDGVGRVLDKLEELGLTENTIVCFLSDNGGPKNNGSDNSILRGYKGDVFEGGIRVPFAMTWPAQIPAGLVYDSPVISLDIFATIVGQATEPIATRNPLDGVNLIPFLKGEKQGAPHDFLYWRKFDQQRYALRHGAEKLILQNEEKMLFDLEEDISETENLAGTQTETYRLLWENFENWHSQMAPAAFPGLYENKEYHENHPDRFKRPD
jgi:arylsulfatase A-like enzyme